MTPVNPVEGSISQYLNSSLVMAHMNVSPVGPGS